jgi:hypothetical protein
MSTSTVFGAVLLNLVVRWGLLLLAFVVFTLVLADARSPGASAYHIGSKPLVYDSRASGVLEPENRVEVVSADLEDGRGIVVLSCGADPAACFRLNKTCNEQVVVADAWDALSVLCTGREAPESLRSRAIAPIIAGYHWARGQPLPDPAGARWLRTPPTMAPICPEAACASLDYGGLARAAGGVLSAQRRLGRVTLWPFQADGPPQPTATADVQALARSHGPTSSGTVYDVAATGGSQFLVSEFIEADVREPKGTAIGRLYLGSIVRESPEQPSTPKIDQSGVELSMSELSTTGLGRPLGVAFSSIANRVYVADADATSLRWSYYDRGPGQWVRHTFWSIRRESEQPWPELQHMIVVKTGKDELVIAAGPDGLYVLHPDDGQLIARIALGVPVQGLAVAATTSGQWLYMTIGRRYLGRLQLKVGEAPAAGIGPS